MAALRKTGYAKISDTLDLSQEQLTRFLRKVIRMKGEPDWLTTIEASAIMGIQPESVQRLCRKGKIVCKKFARDWMVHRTSAEAYIKSAGGRPKKDEFDKPDNLS